MSGKRPLPARDDPDAEKPLSLLRVIKGVMRACEGAIRGMDALVCCRRVSGWRDDLIN
jgi:hypothetical protein